MNSKVRSIYWFMLSKQAMKSFGPNIPGCGFTISTSLDYARTELWRLLNEQMC